MSVNQVGSHVVESFSLESQIKFSVAVSLSNHILKSKSKVVVRMYVLYKMGHSVTMTVFLLSF